MSNDDFADLIRPKRRPRRTISATPRDNRLSDMKEIVEAAEKLVLKSYCTGFTSPTCDAFRAATTTLRSKYESDKADMEGEINDQ